MSDISVIEQKIDALSTEIKDKLEFNLKEIQEDLEAIDNRLDEHSDQIQSLTIWRDSNGSPGAEDRLRCTERFIQGIDREKIPERLNTAEANIVALQRIADSAIFDGVQGAVNATLDRRAKTTIERLKAWGPIIAAIAGPAAGIIIALLSR